MWFSPCKVEHEAFAADEINLVGMMLRQISTERIILVTVLKLLLVDGRKVNSFLFFPLNCRVFGGFRSYLLSDFCVFG